VGTKTGIRPAHGPDADLENSRDVPPARAAVAQLHQAGAVEDHWRPTDFATALRTDNPCPFEPSSNALNRAHSFLLGNRAEDGYDGVSPQTTGVEIRLGEAAEPDAVGTKEGQVLERG
jgi:hypothetical protein